MTTTEAAQLSPSENNLADNGICRRNEAHALFKLLRREAPVHWSGPRDINPGVGNLDLDRQMEAGRHGGDNRDVLLDREGHIEHHRNIEVDRDRHIY